MHRRITLAALAGGGLLATALLQAAAAVADTAPSDTGTDAFTIGSYTFDPYTTGTLANPTPPIEGWAPVHQLSSAPPLMQLGGGTALGTAIAPQDFEVFSPTSGAGLGSIQGAETVTNLLGMTNTEFTVGTVTPGSGESAADLPATGSVYDVFNLGNGIENVYTATPGSGGTVTDTLVTPFGNYNLGSMFGGFNAANPLQPGDAFSGLAGNSNIGADSVTIGNFTFDPMSGTGAAATEGWTPVDVTASAPPLLDIGGASLGDPANAGNDLATQVLDVYTGSGSSATEVGTVTTGVDVTNLLGMTNTELVVTGTHTVAAGSTAADLPAQGTVYDALNLGNGMENVYLATPGSGGTVEDELVTPYGNVNLSSLFGGFNAANPMQPGDAFTGLQSGDNSIGADAFTIDNTTFDPFTGTGAAATEGFAPVYQTIGAPPLLDIGGGTPGITVGGTYFPVPLATQSFDVYSGSGSGATDVGTIATTEDVTNLLGMTNTEFAVTSATAAAGDTSTQAAALPSVGSVYDVFNLGNGLENIYTAIPGAGGGADTIADTLVTPFGNIDLSSLFAGIDAAMPLDPGAAFTGGLDVATAAASTIDPLAFLGL